MEVRRPTTRCSGRVEDAAPLSVSVGLQLPTQEENMKKQMLFKLSPLFGFALMWGLKAC